jgi:hypothetical protein
MLNRLALLALFATSNLFAQLQLVNGASYFNTSFAPLSIAVAYGTKLATSQQQAGVTLPTDLAGTRVTVAGVPAPLYFERRCRCAYHQWRWNLDKNHGHRGRCLSSAVQRQR